MNNVTLSRKRAPLLLRFIAAILLVSFVFGCSTPKILEKKTDLRNAKLMSRPGSNTNTVAFVDILFVYDKDIANTLMPKDAGQWFSNREIYKTKFNRYLDVLSFEVVPITLLKELTFPENYKKARKVILFIDYSITGDMYDIDVTEFKNLVLKLYEDKIEVSDETLEEEIKKLEEEELKS